MSARLSAAASEDTIEDVVADRMRGAMRSAGGERGEQQRSEQLIKLLEGALAPTPQWTRDVVGVHLRSCDRVRGDSPSKYTLKLPSPIPKATTVQLSSISIPTQAIYNIEEPNAALIPIGIPLQPTNPSAPLALKLVVQWKSITPVQCAQVASSIRGNGSTSFDDALQLVEERLVPDIVIPSKRNAVVSIVLDTLDPANYLLFTTEIEHGLEVAIRSYRRLALGIRIAGSGLDAGVPELLPPPASLLSAGIAPDAIVDLIQIVDETNFRVHKDLLLLYANTSVPTTTDGLILAIGTDGVTISADMPTISEAMDALNDAFAAAHAQTDSSLPIPAIFRPTPTSDPTPILELPDTLRLVYTKEGKVALFWIPSSPVSEYVLARNAAYEGSTLAKLDSSARASSQQPFLLPIVCIDVENSSLATYLGFPGALPSPPDDVTNPPSLSPLFEHVRRSQPRRSTQQQQQQQQIIAPVSNPLAPWYSIPLRAASCDGGAWRRDIKLRPGRYDEAPALCSMINERARGLTFLETDPRVVYVGDMGPNEIAVVVPPGDFDDEQLRILFSVALKEQTHDPHFAVDYLAVAVGATDLEACVTNDEVVDVALGDGYPRRTKWRISNTSCNFSLRFEGAWARKLGFLRSTYRDSNAYVSEEFAVETGLPFDFNATAIVDAESVIRLRLSASTPALNVVGGFAPSRGFHRAALTRVIPTPPSSPPLLATVVPDVTDVSLVLGRTRVADVFAIKIVMPDESRRVLTVALADTYNPPVSGILTPYLALSPSTATTALLAFMGSSPTQLPYAEPAGSSARFSLLFTLAQHKCPADLLGFDDSLVYPVDLRLHAGAHNRVTSPSPALERKESTMEEFVGAIYCSGGTGFVVTPRCTALVSSPPLLGSDNPSVILAQTSSNVVIARISSLLESSMVSTPTRKATTLLVHDILSSMRGGAGGGPGGRDGKRLSVSAMEAPFPMRLDSPRVLFLRIAIPGGDNSRTQKYSTVVDGAQLFFFTKLSIGRGGGYTNISEQLMHTDLGSMNDVDEFIISWHKDDMSLVDFHGMEHDMTLLFSIRNTQFITGMQA